MNNNPTTQQKRAAFVDGINEEIKLLYKEVDFRVRNINIYYNEIMKL